MFTASAVVCTIAPSVEIIIAMPLVQGLATAFGLAIPNAMVTDYTAGAGGELFSWNVIVGVSAGWWPRSPTPRCSG